MAEPTPCAVHTDRPATYRCDGCRRSLCDQCVQMSHRLILCVHCGEMAIPVATGRATTSTTVRKVQARDRPYSLLDAFAYPFRGTGAWVFWTYAVILVVFETLPLIVPIAGCFLWIPALVIALLVPRLLFTIVRTTSDGQDELPDWPDFDFWARLGDAFAFFVIVVLCAVPTFLLIWFSGCQIIPVPLEAGGAGAAPSCLPLIALGFLLGVALWIPTFGAPSVYDSFWLLPRIDLHVRALLVAPVEAGIIAVTLAILLVGSYALRFALGLVPLVGTPAAVVVGIYTTFTGAHLVGVYFRRHAETLERLYLA